MVDLLKTTGSGGGGEKEYTVPLDVMQTISKNFSELQEHFEKVTKQEMKTGDERGGEVVGPRVLRIKSVHTVYNSPQPQPPMPEASPSGTVAR